MSFLQRLRKSSLIMATAMTPLVMPAQQKSETFDPHPIEHTISSETHSYLEDIKQNKKIEYNGLSFNMPLLRRIQKDKDSFLSNFDFVLEEKEVGLSFRLPKGRKLLVLMEPEQLENLIRVAIMKDQNPERKEVRPENPHLWKYISRQPRLLVEEQGRRTEMFPRDHQDLYKMALDGIFELDRQGVISLGTMLDKYAEKIGGVKGVSLKSAYYILPNAALKEMIGSLYKDDILKGFANIPQVEAQAREAFEKEKKEQIEIYDIEQAEKDRLLAEKKKRAQEQEDKRVASILHITGNEFVPEIEKNKLNGMVSQVNLSFTEKNNRIVIMDYRIGQKNLDGCIYQIRNDGQWDVKSIQPEEWTDIASVLDKKLTQEQKDDLGVEFFKKIGLKTSKNMNYQLAFLKKIQSENG